MARGGYREGAGRKPGSTNRFSKKLVARAQSEGDLPVDYLLSVMRDETLETRIRVDAAKSAAPYLHHKLASVAVNVSTAEMSHEEWVFQLTPPLGRR